MSAQMLEERYPRREGAGMVTVWLRAEMFFVGVLGTAITPEMVSPIRPGVVVPTSWLIVGNRE